MPKKIDAAEKRTKLRLQSRARTAKRDATLKEKAREKGYFRRNDKTGELELDAQGQPQPSIERFLTLVGRGVVDLSVSPEGVK